MSSIDIRGSTAPVTQIYFADDYTKGCATAHLLEKEHNCKVTIRDGEGDIVILVNKENALNLITALHKAIELDWFTE